MPAIQLIDMMLTRRGAETVAAAANETGTGTGARTTTSEHRKNPIPFSLEWYDMAWEQSPVRTVILYVVLVVGAGAIGFSIGQCIRILLCGGNRRRRRKNSRPKLVPADRVEWEKSRKERHILVRFVASLPGRVLRWVVVWPVYRVAFFVWFPVGFMLVFFVFWWLYPCWRKLWSGNDKAGISGQQQDGNAGHECERGDAPPSFGGGRYRMLTKKEYRRQLRALLMWRLRGKHNHGAAGSLDGDCYFDNDGPEREPHPRYNFSNRKWVVGPNGEAIPPRGKIPPRRRPRSPSPSPLPVIGQPEQPRLGAEEGRDGGPADAQTASMVWVNLSQSKWMAGPNGDALPPGGVMPTAGEGLKCTSWRGAQRVPWEVVNLWGITTHPPSPTT